jgi:sporulation protein YlmC with PRC-barrel domain
MTAHVGALSAPDRGRALQKEGKIMRNSLLLSSALTLALCVPAIASAQQTPTAPQDPAATQSGDADVTVIPPQGDAAAPEATDGTMTDTGQAAEGETLETEPADTATTDTTTTDTTDTTVTDTTTTDIGASTSMGSGVEVSADDMMGRPVIGSDGQQLGEVSDVIVDPETKEMRRLVIDSGGFLGFGAKTIALDRDQVEIRPQEGIIANGLTREDIDALPEYDPKGETASLDQPEPANPAPTGGVTPAPSGGVTSAPAE